MQRLLRQIRGGAKFHFGTLAEYQGQGYFDGSWYNVPQSPLDAIGDAPGAGTTPGERLMRETYRRTIRFKLNGRPAIAQIATHETLVEVLRRDFSLFGARESCGQGLCGCCTALVNGIAVSGCLYLAAFVDGAKVVTIEHMASDGKLSVIQEAFLECGAAQCGFCTPDFVLMAGQLLEAHPHPDEDTIRHYFSGNLCRCAAYAEIVKAVKLAADKVTTA